MALCRKGVWVWVWMGIFGLVRIWGFSCLLPSLRTEIFYQDIGISLSVFDGFRKLKKQRNVVKILRDGKYQAINLSCEIKRKWRLEFETRLHVSNPKHAPLAVLFAFIPLNPLEKWCENSDKMVQTRAHSGNKVLEREFNLLSFEKFNSTVTLF